MKCCFPFNTNIFFDQKTSFIYAGVVVEAIWGWFEEKYWKKKGEGKDVILIFQANASVFQQWEKEGSDCLQEISYIILNPFCEAKWGTSAYRSGVGPAPLLTQMQVIRKFPWDNWITPVGERTRDTGSLFLKRATSAERRDKRASHYCSSWVKSPTQITSEKCRQLFKLLWKNEQVLH